MRNLQIVVAGLLLVGCSSNNNGDDTTDGGGGVTPTASGVFPASGFAGRTLRVEITGDATNWTSSATISFGTGVTVSSVTAASPTDLFADIAIDPTATPGMQDVTVMAGGASFTLKQAFEIAAPATIAFQGVIAQGGITEFEIQNFDTSNPFDTTASQDDEGDTTYPNIAITSPSGTAFQVSAVTDFTMSGVALIDVDAAASAGSVSIASGPAGGTIVNTNAGSMTVTARTATVLASGTAATGNVANPLDSALYSFAPGAAPDVEALTLASATGSPAVAVLPASGHFADLISFGPTNDAINTTTAGGLQYLVYWDNSGSSGYSYTITETDTALTHTTTLTTAEDTTALAPGLTLPSLASAGSVDTTSGSQYMKIAVVAADVGKKIRVITTGDAILLVDVYTSAANANAATPVPFVECEDLGPTDCETPAIAATGTYYVQVQADPNFGTPVPTYTGAVFFE